MLLISLLLALRIASAPLPAGGRVSIVIPEGWRQLTTAEVERMRGKVDPQNKVQQRIRDENPPPSLIVIKHDTDQAIAASAQFIIGKVSPEMKHASAIEVARVIGFVARAAYDGRYDVEPREVQVAGFPAAEWVMRYSFVETLGGKHDMRTRNVLIVRGDTTYLLGYSGPASDTADFDAFDEVVRSLTFE